MISLFTHHVIADLCAIYFPVEHEFVFAKSLKELKSEEFKSVNMCQSAKLGCSKLQEFQVVKDLLWKIVTLLFFS